MKENIQHPTSNTQHPNGESRADLKLDVGCWMLDVGCFLKSSRVALFLSAALLCLHVSAADVHPSKLPPPAARAIDFDRDVRPIFENSCFRCHGPEKPKSHFRLDNRESALKGGDNNSDDIVPGDSARSKLIHYVARVAEDLEMPPAGKADPLTPDQVSVLRAWIDQGANWGAAGTFPQTASTVSPTLRWIDVSGDRKKFREIEGLREGWGGGVEQFSMTEQLSLDEKISAEGHVLVPDRDVRARVSLDKTDYGFIRGGFEQWRRYYDDTGGFYRPFTPPSFDLGRDLHLDTGRAWIDVGLTRPELPQVVVGYEFQFRDGTKSMLEWGGVYDSLGNGKNIYPAAKAIDEQTHILKLDITHEFHGWRMEDNARVEFYRNQTRDAQILSYTTGPTPDGTIQTRDKATHARGANVLRAERQLTDWWFGSGGYLYSRLAGDSSLNQTTFDAGNNPTFGNLWRSDVTLRRETHAFSVASLFLPMDGLTFSLAAQSELSRQEGFGDVHLDFGDPDDPTSIFPQPGTVRSDLDETKVTENAEVRYTKIPFTVLFAQGRFGQDWIGQFEEETGSAAFLRDTDFFNRQADLRAGFNTSPWRAIALNAHYRHRNSDSDYDHIRDTTPGYSAFIRHRDLTTDEIEARLVLRPVSWLKTTLTYRLVASDFFTSTDPATDPGLGNLSPGGERFGGNYDTHTYGLKVLFTPSSRFYCSGTFTYADSRTVTWAGRSIPTVVAPYRGGTYSVIANATFAVNARTTLHAYYSFSEADYGRNNVTDGLPLGLNYTRHGLSAGVTRRLTNYLTSQLRYGFYRYAAPNTGGVNDFTAHGVFATMTVRWP
jgi:Planctomycete cytochrome C